MLESKIFECNCCGITYDEIPLCFGSDYPDYYFAVPANEREHRIELTDSLCIIDNQHFFHRGRISIPIINKPDALIFNVWTTISEANFELRNKMWEDPQRVNQDPYFGWLQTLVPTYNDTLNIKCVAYETEVGYIPEIKVIQEGHALAIDQECGISYATAIEKIQQILRQAHTS